MKLHTLFTKAARRARKASLWLILGLVFSPFLAYGQASIANYTFATNTTGSLTDMSTGTTDVIATSGLIQTAVASATTNFVASGTPFNFYFMGIPYDRFSVNGNGQMRLGNVNNTTAIATSAQTISSANEIRLAPLSGSNALLATTGKVHYKVTGTAPSRVAIVEWKDFNVSNTAGTASLMQVRLYEATGVIEYVYGTMFNSEAGASPRSVAVSANNTATTATFLTTLTGTPTNTNGGGTWTTTSFTASSAMANLNSASDGSRRVFSWTPTTSLAPPTAPLTFLTSPSKVMVNFSAASPTTNVTNYALYISTDNVNFSYVNSSVVGTNSITATGLTYNTTYYFRVYANTEGVQSSTFLSGSVTTNLTPNTYVWNVTTGSQPYTTASNWTPARTLIDETDVLSFSSGGSSTATRYPGGENVGRILVSNNTTINLSGALTSSQLTIKGGFGILPSATPHLSIASGSQLTMVQGVLNYSTLGSDYVGTIEGTLELLGTAGGASFSAAQSITTVKNGGIIRQTQPAGGASNCTLTGSLVTMVFESGATYEHNFGAVGGGTIPTATWQTGSTVLVKGYTTGSTGIGGLGQTFSNFTWNCPAQANTYNLALTGTTITIADNFSVTNTNGNVLRLGGAGTGSVLAKNVSIGASGILELSSGIGTSSLSVSGTFSAATAIRNTGSGSGFITFNGTTAQTPSFVGINGTNPVSIRINNPAGVTASSTPALVINDGATMNMVQGSFAGTISYGATSGTLTYTGTTAQTAGAEFPNTGSPARLTINNTAGVNASSLGNRSLAGTAAILTLSGGILDFGTNTLTVPNNSNAGVVHSGGGYIKGKLARSYTGAATSAQDFPVGQSAKSTFTFFTTITNAGATTITVEVVDAATGGTAGTGMASLNTNRYWKVDKTGAGTFTSANVRVVNAEGVVSNIHALASSTTLAGAYNSIGTTISVANSTVETTAAFATSATDYYVVGARTGNIVSVASGDWNTGSTWNTGVVPTNLDAVTIVNTHAVTIGANGEAKSLNITAGGALTVNGGTLTIADGANPTFRQTTLDVTGPGAGTNYASLTIGAGTIVVHGSVLITDRANFTMNNALATLTIDGNNGTGVQSVPNTRALFSIGTTTTNYGNNGQTLAVTAGTINILNPHINSATNIHSFAYWGGSSKNAIWDNNVTLNLGNGATTQAGVSGAGFRLATFANTGRLRLGNVVVNTTGSAAANIQAITGTGGADMLNLTINTGSEFQMTVGSGTTSCVAGNITNNGTLTSTATLNLFDILGTTAIASANAQTISGVGTFRNLAATANFTNLTINNTNNVIFNGIGAVGTGTVSGTLTMTAGKVDLNGGTFTLGISTTTTGSLAYTDGYFYNGTLKRWYATGTMAATFNATGTFPMGSNNTKRIVLMSRTNTFTTGGTISVTANGGAGSSVVAFTDGAYNVNRISNANWIIAGGDGIVLGTNPMSLRITGSGTLTPLTSAVANMRIVQPATAVGTYAAATGSEYVYDANRTAIPSASFFATYHIGADVVDLNNLIESTATGNWEDGSTWLGGVVPTNVDYVRIKAGHTVTVNAVMAEAENLDIEATGALVVSGSSLTIDQNITTAGNVTSTGGTLTVSGSAAGSGVTLSGSAIFLVNGGTTHIGTNNVNNDRKLTVASGTTLTVQNGTLNIYGNVTFASGSFFNQSGGTINVDGNSGTALTSLGNVTHFDIATDNVNCSAGTIRLVDPPHSSVTHTVDVFKITVSSDQYTDFSGTHTLIVGEPTSATQGSTSGFTINTSDGTGEMPLQTLIVDGGNLATERFMATGIAVGTPNTHIKGNFTVMPNAEFRHIGTTGDLAVGGDLINNGTFISSATGTGIIMGAGFSETYAAATTQTITGTGTYANAVTGATANFTNLRIRNLQTSGTVTTSLSALSFSGQFNFDTGIFDAVGKSLTFHTHGSPLPRTSGTLTVDATTNISFGTPTLTAGSAYTIPNNIFTASPSIGNFSLYRLNNLTLNNQPLTVNGTFQVANTGRLVRGTSTLTLNATATVITDKALENGVGYSFSNFALNTNLFMNALNYIYQIGTNSNVFTGSFLPATVDNFTINHTGTTNKNLILTNALTVGNTLTMTSGNIDGVTNSRILELGTSAVSTGTLAYTGGVILGQFKRWISATATGYDFPIGISTQARNMNIAYTGAPTTGGSLTAQFIAGEAGTTGLPVMEGATTVTTVAKAVWQINAGDGLTDGTYIATMNGFGFNGITDFTKLVMLKRANNASAWTLQGTHITTTGSNSAPVLQRTGLTGFSEYGVGGGESNPLPITLLGFEGRRVEGLRGEMSQDVKLSWTTASEINNKGFEVQVSEDGLTYRHIAFVDGVGNTATVSSYQLAVINTSDSYYRLKQVDFDGKFTYSPVVFVEGIEIVNVYPNPNKGTFTLTSQSPLTPKGGNALRLFNAQGKEVPFTMVDNKITISPFGGKGAFSPSGSGASGIYFLHVIRAGKVKVVKVIVE